jgi:hypothetical protein
VGHISNEIRVGDSDPDINGLLGTIGDQTRPFSRHFSHSEDFFLELEAEYTVDHLPIHHDVRRRKPDAAYRATLRDIVSRLVSLAPQALKELTYFFDPVETLRPCFYRLYTVEDRRYLYLLRADLNLRPGEATVIERGTNDTTPRFSTRRLFLEAAVVPVEGEQRIDGRLAGFRVRQTISQTWIGEFGRGYFQQGIWMDADLTKFFSRLFLPAGRRVYPFFPYLCRYKTVCASVIGLSPDKRLASVPRLDRSIGFLDPAMERIQSEMKSMSFSEELGYFRELKAKVPPAWYDDWRNVRVESYLNASEMREFRVED